MNPDYPPGAFFKHIAVVPQKLVRHWKHAAKSGALDKCYAAVDRRDGLVCQVTGKALKAGHADPALRLTRDPGPRTRDPPGAAEHAP